MKSINKLRENKIAVLLFDLGGVLVKLTGVPFMQDWTRNSLDKNDEEMLWMKWLNCSAVRRFETGKSSVDQFAQQLILEMEMLIEPAEFIKVFKQWPAGLYPGAAQLLRKLRPDYTLACLSNSNEIHWPRLMTDMGMHDFFDHHFASHLMGRLKPDRDCFDYVIGKLNCDSSAILFLDDNELNVVAAQKAGIHACKVKGLEEVERLLTQAGILTPPGK